MRIYIAILLLFIICDYAFTQGFSEKYDFGSEAYFYNALLQNDTLVVGGARWDEEAGKVSPLLAFMDTLGNILQYESYTDTSSHLVFKKGYPLIRDSEGHYLMMGDVLEKESDFLIKWDRDGTFISLWEYPYPPDVWTSFPEVLLETTNGYLIVYGRQMEGGQTDVFVTKINKQGVLQWEQSYGSQIFWENVNSAWQVDADTYVIGASRPTDIYPVSNGVPCSRSWFFAVDSLGGMKWEHFGEPCESGRSYGLRPTDDGGWIYATSELQVYNQATFGYAPKLVKLDSGFDVVWERKVGESYWDMNIMIDFEQAPDGGWLGVGSWLQPEPLHGWSGEYVYLPGCTVKFSAEGDSVWARFDTLAVPENTKSYEFGGVVMLPSGSSIAVGNFDEDPPGTGNVKAWAWALKLDANGCLGGECAYTNIMEWKSGEMEVEVFPNPANGHVTFQWEDLGQKGKLRIMDLTGKIIWTKEINGNTRRTTWVTNGAESGIYFYRFKNERGEVRSGKVILQK